MGIIMYKSSIFYLVSKRKPPEVSQQLVHVARIPTYEVITGALENSAYSAMKPVNTNVENMPRLRRNWLGAVMRGGVAFPVICERMP